MIGRMLARVAGVPETVSFDAPAHRVVGELAWVDIPPNCVITEFDAQRAAERLAIVNELVARYQRLGGIPSEYDDLLQRLETITRDT